jgi:hypothetical protein
MANSWSAFSLEIEWTTNPSNYRLSQCCLTSVLQLEGTGVFNIARLLALEFGLLRFVRQPKVGVLRASHKIFNSELRICWNDASKFNSISSSELTFCCLLSAKLKISWHDQRYSGQNARISAHYIALLIVSWFKNQYARWQLYHHLFPEKARIVQCYYSPFWYSYGATRQATRRLATDSPSSPIAAFYPRAKL